MSTKQSTTLLQQPLVNNPPTLSPTSTPLIPPLQLQRSLTTIGLPTNQLLQSKQAIPLATSLIHHGNKSFPLFFHLVVTY
jgi:hypothetical protein